MDDDVNRARPLHARPPGAGNDDAPAVEPGERISETRARAGVTGHNVRYVLFAWLALAIIAGLLVYAGYGG